MCFFGVLQKKRIAYHNKLKRVWTGIFQIGIQYGAGTCYRCIYSPTQGQISARPEYATNLLRIRKYQLHFTAYWVKKENIHSSHVLEDGLSGKYLVIAPLEPKLKNH